MSYQNRLPHKASRAAGALLACAGLVGCATPTPPLYDWGGYTSATYQFLKGGDFDPRLSIIRLEEQLQKTAAFGRAPPPGLHGHLALLYTKIGDDSNAQNHLLRERARFPESAAYMDFLLKNSKIKVAQ